MSSTSLDSALRGTHAALSPSRANHAPSGFAAAKPRFWDDRGTCAAARTRAAVDQREGFSALELCDGAYSRNESMPSFSLDSVESATLSRELEAPAWAITALLRRWRAPLEVVIDSSRAAYIQSVFAP